MEEILTTNTFEQFTPMSTIMLTTFKRNGTPVGTPTWLIVRDGTLYVKTYAGLGKVKRIRNMARVLVAPCTATGKVTGQAYEGKARVLTAEEGMDILKAIRKRYGFQDMFFTQINRWRGLKEPIAIEIVPTGTH